MNPRLDRATTILSGLISFPTVSAAPNRGLIDHAADLLEPHASRLTIVGDATGAKANLFATIGPEGDDGVVLSGHTDVVPAEGQEWTVDPFAGLVSDDRVWGRGAADMKGFIACVLASAEELAAAGLRRPVHVALTHDEEVGCVGARELLGELARTGPKPAAAIVGEPTSLRIIDAHKGCYEYTTTIRGLEGHASLPDRSVSAIHAAMRFIGRLSELQAELAEQAPAGSIFDPPYTTLNVGTISGGVARNITAGSVTFDWEMRPVRVSDARWVLDALERFVADELLPEMRAIHPESAVETVTLGTVDGLEPDPSSPALELASALTGSTQRSVVSFGTEAGLYQAAGIPAVVCGPGDIAQAHRPDEFIELAQLDACLDLIDRLATRLSSG